MIDYDGIRQTIVTGLKDYLKCPVIRSNQNATPPKYPFISYTVTMPMSENNGTYEEYEDGTKRKAVTQTWSISALSDDNTESVTLACKAREWLDCYGTTYLNDNDVIIQSVGSVTNRDNIITIEYEYKNGFDIVIYLFDTVGSTAENDGIIESVVINGQQTKEANPQVNELTEKLARRLDGIGEVGVSVDLPDTDETITIDGLTNRLARRLDGEV